MSHSSENDLDKKGYGSDIDVKKETEEQDSGFQVGDLVWAKMKGYPYWPGIVVSDNELKNVKKKKPSQIAIFFYGTENYQYIDSSMVVEYFKHRTQFSKASKSQGFPKAVAAAEAYIATCPELIAKGESIREETICSFKEEREKEFENVYARVPDRSDEQTSQETDDDNEGTSKRSYSGTDSTEPLTKKMAATDKKSTPVQKAPSTASGSGSGRRRSTAQMNGNARTSGQSAAAASLSTPTTARKMVLDKVSPKSIGFIGLGVMGSGMVKNLIDSGHHVTVYNRSYDKCINYLRDGKTKKADSPADLMEQCDIVFSCVSDKAAVNEILSGSDGILSVMSPGKSYVEMTTLDVVTSSEFFEQVTAKGGRFLEAPICGTKQEANMGNLVFLCSGNRGVFEDCQSMFHAMGRRSVYLGDITNGIKAKLVYELLHGVLAAGVSESLALADRLGLSQHDVIEILSTTGVSCPLLRNVSQEITENVFIPSFKLEYLQNDLQSVINLGNIVEQPLPVTATVNELFKMARKKGQGTLDYTAIYRMLDI